MFNQLMRGNTDDVLYILDQKSLDERELRAALINAFNRIANLEKQLSKITNAYAQGQRDLMAITQQPRVDG